MELVVTNTGDSDLHLQGISAPDWLEVTPADPNVILQLQEQFSLCVEPDCGLCTGKTLSGYLVLFSNDPNNPNGFHNVPVTMTCGSFNVPVESGREL